MLAKVVVRSTSSSFEQCVLRARRAIAEFHIGGIATTKPMLAALLDHPAFMAGEMVTSYLGDHPEIIDLSPNVDEAAGRSPLEALLRSSTVTSDLRARSGAGSATRTSSSTELQPVEGAVVAGVTGTVVEVLVEPGAVVERGASVIVLTAMKMETVVRAPERGRVKDVLVAQHDMVTPTTAVVVIESSMVAELMSMHVHLLRAYSVRADGDADGLAN